MTSIGGCYRSNVHFSKHQSRFDFEGGFVGGRVMCYSAMKEQGLIFSLIREQANTASANNYARRKPRHFIPNKKTTQRLNRLVSMDCLC